MAGYVGEVAFLSGALFWAGYVGEVYGHGITLAWNLVGGLPGFFLATYVFLPIIYPLKLNSINEVSLSLKIPIFYPLKLNSINEVSLSLKIPIIYPLKLKSF